MYTYIYININICIYIHIYINTYTYIDIYIHVCLCVCIPTLMYICRFLNTGRLMIDYQVLPFVCVCVGF